MGKIPSGRESWVWLRPANAGVPSQPWAVVLKSPVHRGASDSNMRIQPRDLPGTRSGMTWLPELPALNKRPGTSLSLVSLRPSPLYRGKTDCLDWGEDGGGYPAGRDGGIIRRGSRRSRGKTAGFSASYEGGSRRGQESDDAWVKAGYTRISARLAGGAMLGNDYYSLNFPLIIPTENRLNRVEYGDTVKFSLPAAQVRVWWCPRRTP